MDNSKDDSKTVVIAEGESPHWSIVEAIEGLGGMDRFIDKDDVVFIKTTLNLPNGFPTNCNFEVLNTLIRSCLEVGAKKVLVGSYPYKGITIKTLSDLLGLKDFLERLGAELAYLDNSDYFGKGKIEDDLLKKLKTNSLSTVNVNEKEFLVPKVILNADKFIILNQVKVHPLFKFTSAILNAYSMIPNNYQNINPKKEDEYISNDEYKKDLISNILDVFTIRPPDLIFNDLYYILEGAGPYIYRDSHLHKTKVIVAGRNALGVDMITSKVLNLDIPKNDLISEAKKRDFGLKDISELEISGKDINSQEVDIELCSPILKNIDLHGMNIHTGEHCSGCWVQAYHLLNLMKSNMIKDLKYNPNNRFLIGKSPKLPDSEQDDHESKANILLFGDCAIDSTKDSDFRAKSIEKRALTPPFKKVQKKKQNKNVLELPGCPPDIIDCVEKMVEYYKKSNAPTLNVFLKTIKSYLHQSQKEILEKWEGI